MSNTDQCADHVDVCDCDVRRDELNEMYGSDLVTPFLVIDDIGDVCVFRYDAYKTFDMYRDRCSFSPFD